MSTESESSLSKLNPQEKRVLVGFFELLLKVDKRVNPELYPVKVIPPHWIHMISKCIKNYQPECK